jgi:N-acetylglucosamine kinase-like BadF-type ATPase
VAGQDKIDILCRSFQKVFPGAKAEAYSDLLAAARCLCGTGEGIAAILGTGANTCFYDGEKIVDNVPACGYILGDEGGGAVLGKKIHF